MCTELESPRPLGAQSPGPGRAQPPSPHGHQGAPAARTTAKLACRQTPQPGQTRSPGNRVSRGPARTGKGPLGFESEGTERAAQPRPPPTSSPEMRPSRRVPRAQVQQGTRPPSRRRPAPRGGCHLRPGQPFRGTGLLCGMELVQPVSPQRLCTEIIAAEPGHTHACHQALWQGGRERGEEGTAPDSGSPPALDLGHGVMGEPLAGLLLVVPAWAPLF